MNKKTKLLIGFIGDHNVGKSYASNLLKKHNFHKASINDKVEEFAKCLCTKEELETNRSQILNKIRKRGSEVHKEYWINLILISVPDDKDYIVFDDLSVDEIECNKIKAYQIYRPNVSRIRLDNIETIENDGNLEEFSTKIEKLYEKLTNKKLK